MVKHTTDNPFPMKVPLGTVLDERCWCGHLRSEHEDTAAYGHGACKADGVPACPCPKFTWKSFIFKTSQQVADFARGRKK